MRARLVLLVVCCALLPLLAPVEWTRRGLLPDAAVLAVVYAALRAGPECAAGLGVAIGFAACPWTAEPLGQTAVLLGVLGWAVGHAGRSLERDRLPVRAGVVLLGVFVVRGAAAASARIATTGGLFDAGVGAHAASIAMCALATALCAPLAFSLLEHSRLLAEAERRARLRV